ncbi:MAG: DUF2330 domain-containing protein [Myxococcaceae bacterium]|nr:DUF2330 domain-containing protein [Myxococcaceae bacterium]
MTHLLLRSALTAVAVGVGLYGSAAEACGCFAGPTTATTPVIQAGERILFAVQNGKVTAHIQIQYAGDAKDFGWLLPLPSVPVLKAGTEELFTQLAATTDPTFQLNSQVVGQCPQRSPGFSFGCAARAPTTIDRVAGGTSAMGPPPSPLVFTTSVGPYDAAVLKADDKSAMLAWLSANRFVVPTTSDAALAPYLRPGAYFLALKLKSGKTTGDLTPIVVEYPSDLPMIPITLTSIGATPDMGVQVFVVGNGRAIPRNYRHVVLNDALLDWESGGQNYQALVTRAVREAPGRHAFVTDYAGTSSVMRDVLAPAGRFGTEAELAARSTPTTFISTLWARQFGIQPPVTGFAGQQAQRFPPALQDLLLRALPIPKTYADQGLTADEWFANFTSFYESARQQHPADFANYPVFNAPQLAQQVFADYVAPVREANALFTTFPTLTRLFTTLSPEDMTRDPVFSFNTSLPEVPRVRTATQEFDCPTGRSRVVTPGGFSRAPVFGQPADLPPGLGAHRIEALGEEGPGTVETDNTELIRAAFPDPPPAMPTPGGCSAVPDPVSVALLVLVARLRHRR